MPVEYANWDEVWGPPQKRSHRTKKDPTCSLLRSPTSYDNIVDAYDMHMEEPRQEKRPKRQRPLCHNRGDAKVNGSLDSFYEPLRPHVEPVLPTRQCEFNVHGIGEYDYESSLSFDRYFDENNLFCAPQSKEQESDETQQYSTTEQENAYLPYAEEEVEWRPTTIEEEEAVKITQPTSSSQQYIDLTLYVISGIFIIFMMEQVLQLGMYLGQV
jgi:hypothetical protein